MLQGSSARGVAFVWVSGCLVFFQGTVRQYNIVSHSITKHDKPNLV